MAHRRAMTTTPLGMFGESAQEMLDNVRMFLCSGSSSISWQAAYMVRELFPAAAKLSLSLTLQMVTSGIPCICSPRLSLTAPAVEALYQQVMRSSWWTWDMLLALFRALPSLLGKTGLACSPACRPLLQTLVQVGARELPRLYASRETPNDLSDGLAEAWNGCACDHMNWTLVTNLVLPMVTILQPGGAMTAPVLAPLLGDAMAFAASQQGVCSSMCRQLALRAARWLSTAWLPFLLEVQPPATLPAVNAADEDASALSSLLDCVCSGMVDWSAHVTSLLIRLPLGLPLSPPPGTDTMLELVQLTPQLLSREDAGLCAGGAACAFATEQVMDILTANQMLPALIVMVTGDAALADALNPETLSWLGKVPHCACGNDLDWATVAATILRLEAPAGRANPHAVLAHTSLPECAQQAVVHMANALHIISPGGSDQGAQQNTSWDGPHIPSLPLPTPPSRPPRGSPTRSRPPPPTRPPPPFANQEGGGGEGSYRIADSTATASFTTSDGQGSGPAPVAIVLASLGSFGLCMVLVVALVCRHRRHQYPRRRRLHTTATVARVQVVGSTNATGSVSPTAVPTPASPSTGSRYGAGPAFREVAFVSRALSFSRFSLPWSTVSMPTGGTTAGATPTDIGLGAGSTTAHGAELEILEDGAPTRGGFV